MVHDLDHLLARTARLGALINIAIPAAVALLAYAIRLGVLSQLDSSESNASSVLFSILVAVAVTDLIGAFMLRKSLFTAERVRTIRHDPAQVEQWLVRSATIVFAVGASPILIGAAFYIWSGDLRHLALFGIMTLLAYRLFRPTRDQLNELLGDSEPL